MFSLFTLLSEGLRFGRAHLIDRKVEEGISVQSLLAEWSLSNSALRKVAAELNKMLEAGLAHGAAGSSVAMLPSYVPSPVISEVSGKFLALDLGGTNLRTILFDVVDGETHIENWNFKVPQSAMTGTGEALFDYIAQCLATFLDETKLKNANLPLGFTFSYPCDQTSIRCSKLNRWTKGFNASGVVNRDVVELLERSIARIPDIKVRVVAILNDTVGTQVSAAFDHKNCDLGVIIATGTNAAYVEKVSNMTGFKDSSYCHDAMIIDTEWGAFGDRGELEFVKTEYDRIVDSRSVHPGIYNFDKLIAGMYMGELVRLVLQKMVSVGLLFHGVGSELLSKEGSFPTKYISEILSDEGGYVLNTRQILDELGIEHFEFGDILIVREVCIAVSRRAANLAAAAVSAILNRMKLKKATVGIDGSTYKFHPFYHSWLSHKVAELLECKTDVNYVQANDGSGKGAALVAAIADRLSRR